MSKKEEKKDPIMVKLSTVLLIWAVIIIAVIAYLAYIVSINKSETEQLTGAQINTNTYYNKNSNEINTTDTQTNSKTILKQGVYYVEGITIDAETYGIKSIEIKENEKFSINIPLGTSYIGTYKIQGNKLICTATQKEEQEGGYAIDDIDEIKFTFKITGKESLSYIEASKDESEFNLTKGRTYSLGSRDQEFYEGDSY